MPSTTAQQNRTRRDRARALAKSVRNLTKTLKKTVVVTVTASNARAEFSTWINTVSFSHKWLVLKRHGKPAVAMVPIEDLNVLRKLEDRVDLEAAREALKEPGEAPWEEVKAKLGL
jgi:PHD/YefM family antitoxin component YafN of YafNO toxin-antitoxin module